jgi:hypothetical protein
MREKTPSRPPREGGVFPHRENFVQYYISLQVLQEQLNPFKIIDFPSSMENIPPLGVLAAIRRVDNPPREDEALAERQFRWGALIKNNQCNSLRTRNLAVNVPFTPPMMWN